MVHHGHIRCPNYDLKARGTELYNVVIQLSSIIIINYFELIEYKKVLWLRSFSTLNHSLFFVKWVILDVEMEGGHR